MPWLRRLLCGGLLAMMLAPGAIAGAMPDSRLDTGPLLPDFESVRAAHRPSEVGVFDRDGDALGSVRRDYSERRGRWIPLSDVSPALQRAVLLSEDQRFYEHSGVDWRAVAAAGWGWVWGSGLRGASTVSMQLVSMLDPVLQRPRGGRSLEQKVRQVRQARRLEASWTKGQILEAYVNMAAFRGELRGVDAVSQAMFGKHSHGLDRREAAVAAALLRGPNAPTQRVATRACSLLQSAGAPQACRNLSMDTTRWLASTARQPADQPSWAPHFARAVVSRLDSNTDSSVRTTLDGKLQRYAVDSVRRHLAGMSHAQLTDAAVIVMDNDSAEVLAYVGSSGAGSAASDVDHARARRQAGSTLKPFLYALALEMRYITAATLLNDAPLDLATVGGMYMPTNYDRRHAGWVSVRTALASSLNIPAVRTLMLVGPERFADRLRKLGLPLVRDADHYGYSLSLGSADVDLLSLTNAYRILAHGGRRGAPIMVPQAGMAQAESAQVLDPLPSWIVGDILSDRGARARTFGLENALTTRFWTAVKTGTSKDMRDNWTVGWSATHTVGVWVGNSAGLSMRNVSGVSGAAPIWHDIMSYLHANVPSHQPAVPDELVSQHVVFGEEIEAARTEYFLRGTEISRVELAKDPFSAHSRIVSPVPGTTIALDPDIPMVNQRLALRAALNPSHSEAVFWRIGTTRIASGADADWFPFPGHHRIVLEDDAGVVLDEVFVQVRGLPLLDRRR